LAKVKKKRPRIFKKYMGEIPPKRRATLAKAAEARTKAAEKPKIIYPPRPRARRLMPLRRIRDVIPRGVDWGEVDGKRVRLDRYFDESATPHKSVRKPDIEPPIIIGGPEIVPVTMPPPAQAEVFNLREHSFGDDGGGDDGGGDDGAGCAGDGGCAGCGCGEGGCSGEGGCTGGTGGSASGGSEGCAGCASCADAGCATGGGTGDTGCAVGGCAGCAACADAGCAESGCAVGGCAGCAACADSGCATGCATGEGTGCAFGGCTGCVGDEGTGCTVGGGWADNAGYGFGFDNAGSPAGWGPGDYGAWSGAPAGVGTEGNFGFAAGWDAPAGPTGPEGTPGFEAPGSPFASVTSGPLSAIDDGRGAPSFDETGFHAGVNNYGPTDYGTPENESPGLFDPGDDRGPTGPAGPFGNPGTFGPSGSPFGAPGPDSYSVAPADVNDVVDAVGRSVDYAIDPGFLDPAPLSPAPATFAPSVQGFPGIHGTPAPASPFAGAPDSLTAAIAEAPGLFSIEAAPPSPSNLGVYGPGNMAAPAEAPAPASPAGPDFDAAHNANFGPGYAGTAGHFGDAFGANFGPSGAPGAPGDYAGSQGHFGDAFGANFGPSGAPGNYAGSQGHFGDAFGANFGPAGAPADYAGTPGHFADSFDANFGPTGAPAAVGDRGPGAVADAFDDLSPAPAPGWDPAEQVEGVPGAFFDNVSPGKGDRGAPAAPATHEAFDPTFEMTAPPPAPVSPPGWFAAPTVGGRDPGFDRGAVPDPGWPAPGLTAGIPGGFFAGRDAPGRDAPGLDRGDPGVYDPSTYSPAPAAKGDRGGPPNYAGTPGHFASTFSQVGLVGPQNNLSPDRGGIFDPPDVTAPPPAQVAPGREDTPAPPTGREATTTPPTSIGVPASVQGVVGTPSTVGVVDMSHTNQSATNAINAVMQAHPKEVKEISKELGISEQTAATALLALLQSPQLSAMLTVLSPAALLSIIQQRGRQVGQLSDVIPLMPDAAARFPLPGPISDLLGRPPFPGTPPTPALKAMGGAVGGEPWYPETETEDYQKRYRKGKLTPQEELRASMRGQLRSPLGLPRPQLGSIEAKRMRPMYDLRDFGINTPFAGPFAGGGAVEAAMDDYGFSEHDYSSDDPNDLRNDRGQTERGAYQNRMREGWWPSDKAVKGARIKQLPVPQGYRGRSMGFPPDEGEDGIY
jgi:hypothetical protein